MGFPISFRPNSQFNQIDVPQPAGRCRRNLALFSECEKSYASCATLGLRFSPDEASQQARNIISAMRVVV
jgi:hypothetical protein